MPRELTQCQLQHYLCGTPWPAEVALEIGELDVKAANTDEDISAVRTDTGKCATHALPGIEGTVCNIRKPAG